MKIKNLLKFKILLIILILPLVILGLIKLGQNQAASTPTAASLPPEVDKFKNLEIIQASPNTPKYNLKSLGGDVVEIGTERHSPPKPYLKLSKWNNEASLRVNIPYETTDYPEVIPVIRLGGSDSGQARMTKLVYQSDKKSIEFYSKTPEEIVSKDSRGGERKFTINEEGGVEFDVVLTEKPATNSLEFPLDATNLEFLYQPPLNKEGLRPGNVSCSETECLDKDGNIVRYRPENVVGSYAVYYKDNKSGDFTALGGKNYKAGKAFHIYRPLITDAQGKTTWGNLTIEQSNNSTILTVTIPQSFLNSASYPLRVDPNFGYESRGGSMVGLQFDASKFTAPADGTISLIKAYIWITATVNLNYGYYNVNGTAVGTHVAHGTSASFGVQDTWATVNVTGSITSGTAYFLAAESSNASKANIYFDSGGSNQEAYGGAIVYDTWADSPTVSYYNNKVSIYATYSSGGGATNYTNINGLNLNGFNIN